MKKLFAVLTLVSAVAGYALGQEPQRPFPNHEEPPPDWFCRPMPLPGEGPEHECHCKRMVHSDQSCEDPRPIEDPVCSVWCHKDHCRCPEMCTDEPTPKPPEQNPEDM